MLPDGDWKPVAPAPLLASTPRISAQSRGSASDRLAAVRGQRDVDVAARRVRVRADRVGSPATIPRGQLGVLDLPDRRTCSSTSSAKPRSSVGDQRHLAVDRDVADLRAARAARSRRARSRSRRRSRPRTAARGSCPRRPRPSRAACGAARRGRRRSSRRAPPRATAGHVRLRGVDHPRHPSGSSLVDPRDRRQRVAPVEDRPASGSYMRSIGRNAAAGVGSQFARSSGSSGSWCCSAIVERPVLGGNDPGRPVADRVAVLRVGDEVHSGRSYIVIDQNAPTGGGVLEAQGVAQRAVERRAVSVDVDRRVAGLVAVVAPQPGARRDRAAEVALRDRPPPPLPVRRSSSVPSPKKSRL